MANPKTVVPSAARTTSGDSGPISLAEELAYGGSRVALLLDVTATSGTPSMTIAIEWSNDGVTFAPADPADTHGAAITAAAKRVKAYDVKGLHYRIVWTITGTTPSLTFSVSALGVT